MKGNRDRELFVWPFLDCYFDDSFTGSEYGGETEVLSTNFGLSLSYSLDSRWSFGGGIDLIYGQGTLKRNLSQQFPESLLVGGTVRPIAIPDSDRQWFSGGATYRLGTSSKVDFGLAYVLGKDVTVDQSTVNPLGSGNLSS